MKLTMHRKQRRFETGHSLWLPNTCTIDALFPASSNIWCPFRCHSSYKLFEWPNSDKSARCNTAERAWRAFRFRNALEILAISSSSPPLSQALSLPFFATCFQRNLFTGTPDFIKLFSTARHFFFQPVPISNI